MSEDQIVGTFICSSCEHSWTGSHPPGIHILCPECGRLSGRSARNIVPSNKQVVRCRECSSPFFTISVDPKSPPLISCKDCGVDLPYVAHVDVRFEFNIGE